jgi:hypothetical protein
MDKQKYLKAMMDLAERATKDLLSSELSDAARIKARIEKALSEAGDGLHLTDGEKGNLGKLLQTWFQEIVKEKNVRGEMAGNSHKSFFGALFNKNKEAHFQKADLEDLAQKLAEALGQSRADFSAEEKNSAPRIDLAYKKIKETVVGIYTKDGSGSGVFLNNEGLIVSNWHVVDFDREVVIRLHSSEELKGKVLRAWRNPDLAFIRCSVPSSCGVAPLWTDKHSEGEMVFSVGAPYQMEKTVTSGIISASRRLIYDRHYIQHSAAINPGNSGGPLFNLQGKLLGINTFSRRDAQGLFFAIPVNDVIERMGDLKADESQYCPVCGHQSPPESWYCHFCGSSYDTYDEKAKSVDENSYHSECPSCNRKRGEDEKYCAHCGSSLKKE